MTIPRLLEKEIENKLIESNKVILLYGARQVGKTTLIKSILSKQKKRVLSINADELRYIEVLSSRNSDMIAGLTSGYDILFIDEAQRVPEIGLNLKIIHDSQPDLKIIATGSSSFELARKVSEPLTGRAWTFTLFPVSFKELAELNSPFELNQQLHERLVFGSYPEIFNYRNLKDKKSYLEELSRNYLYKDIFELTSIRNIAKVRDLLRLLSYQIGSEVSLNELATQLEISKNTVVTYIDLLEKSFVLTRLSGFSRNLRKEVVKKDKFYFNDLGIRNILIDDLKPFSDRFDTGSLWENFIIIERLKKNGYEANYSSSYFWRTYTGSEIDYVESGEAGLSGYEIKYKRKKVRIPSAWKTEYNGKFEVIDNENYLNFIT